MAARTFEVSIPLVSVLAFLRVMSNPALFEAPMSVGEAVEVATEWLSRPNVGIAQPTRWQWGCSPSSRGPVRRARSYGRPHRGAGAQARSHALHHGPRHLRLRGLTVEDPLTD